MTQSFNWEKMVENEWDDRAYVWDERSRNMWDKGSRKDIIPFIQKHVQTGVKIIDIGCGSGYGTYKLHEAGFEVEGIDISKEMIHIAGERLNDKNIPLHHGDINHLPMPDNYCESVMAINVLEWTNHPSVALNELKRILKREGLLCAGILGPTAGPRANGYRRLYGENVIMNSMMPWEFLQLAKEQGFTLLDSFGVYKREIKENHLIDLPRQLKQSLSFMWVFMLKKI